MTSSSIEVASVASALVRDIAKLLVQFPEQVTVETRSDETSMTFVLRVAPQDVGAIVGKDGRTARSLRTLVVGFFRKSGTHFHLDIEGQISGAVY